MANGYTTALSDYQYKFMEVAAVFLRTATTGELYAMESFVIEDSRLREPWARAKAKHAKHSK